MNKSLLLLLIAVVFSSCNQRDQEVTESTSAAHPLKDSLTTELEDIHKRGHIAGFSVAIVNQEGILYEKGIGFADVDNKVPYTENTLQNIASISKTAIGLVLLKAQEMGKLNLDDPIDKYLPFEVENPYYPDVPITIRHLTTHTSSIVDSEAYDAESYILKEKIDSSATVKMDRPENFNPPENKIPMSEFLENVLSEDGKWYTKDAFLEKKPGELFEYTNVGATLAAAVLEYATGESYDEFTRKYIFQPLGMSASGWSFDDIDFSKHTKMYADSVTQLPFYSLITYPDGGLLTSSHDLGIYLVELIKGYSGNGTILKKESYTELYEKQLNDNHFTERDAESPYNDEYDFGVFIGFSAKGYIGHTGGDPGVSSFMFFDTEKKIGRFMMINTNLYNREGVQEFFAIWDKLEEYQDRLN
jgi:CubicO group peptidase (beta-lactamase class C family)